MKKRLMSVLTAFVLLTMCWLPAACAAEVDEGIILEINGEGYYGLPAGDGQVLISEADMTALAEIYFDLMNGSFGKLNVRLGNADGYQSDLLLRIGNLKQFQEAWRNKRGNNNVQTVPVQLTGAKASATFDGDAQNSVRRAALVPAGAQLFQFLLRSAKAAVTGGGYPDKSVAVSVAVQEWTEFKNDLNNQQKAAISQYEVLGGVRAKVGLSVGGAAFSHVNALKLGSVALKAPMLPAADGKMDLVALLVNENGSTAQVPVTVKGKNLYIDAKVLGDYVVIERPVNDVPTTGDNASLWLWSVLTLISGAGVMIIFRKKLLF